MDVDFVMLEFSPPKKTQQNQTFCSASYLFKLAIDLSRCFSES